MGVRQVKAGSTENYIIPLRGIEGQVYFLPGYIEQNRLYEVQRLNVMGSQISL